MNVRSFVVARLLFTFLERVVADQKDADDEEQAGAEIRFVKKYLLRGAIIVVVAAAWDRAPILMREEEAAATETDVDNIIQDKKE